MAVGLRAVGLGVSVLVGGMGVGVTVAVTVGGPGVGVTVAGGVTCKINFCPGLMMELLFSPFQTIKSYKGML